MTRAGELLPAKIRWLLDRHGLSVQEFAEAVGIQRTHAYRLRSGQATNPSLNLLEKLSDYFQVDPGFFFDTTESDLDVLFLAKTLRDHVPIDDLGVNLSTRKLAETIGELDPEDRGIVEELVDRLKALAR